MNKKPWQQDVEWAIAIVFLGALAFFLVGVVLISLGAMWDWVMA